MRNSSVFGLLLVAIVAATATQAGSARAFSDDEFWASYWARPKVIWYGAEEESFYQNLKAVMFARNEFSQCVNPEALDDDARWLKEHPAVRFYVDGYASKRGELLYNLVLSQRRADWVKQELVARGVAEDRIRLAVGWGELYPTCLDESDECRAKNKLVRLTYVPGQ